MELPGWKVDLGETMEETAKRETQEETNLEVADLELVSLTNEMRYLKDGKQFVVIGFKANSYQGELKLNNPERFHEWGWFSLNNLPSPLFEGTELMIENYQAGKIYQEGK
jgi:8-oxo-dGTP diphosphatase